MDDSAGLLMQEGQPHAIGLLTHRNVKLQPGQELTISYGDRSNEELLNTYGRFQPRILRKCCKGMRLLSVLHNKANAFGSLIGN